MIFLNKPFPPKCKIEISSNPINIKPIGIFAKNIPDVKIGIDGSNVIHFLLEATTKLAGYSGVWLQHHEFAH